VGHGARSAVAFVFLLQQLAGHGARRHALRGERVMHLIGPDKIHEHSARLF